MTDGMRSFFFNDTATTEIYTLSLHDALPIWLALHEVHHQVRRAADRHAAVQQARDVGMVERGQDAALFQEAARSEEHTSELQSRQYLVCRLLLEKKKHTHIFKTDRENVVTPA